MSREIFLCILVGLLAFPCVSPAASFFGSGEIDQGLSYSSFEITPDGMISGVIINKSKHPRNDLKIDMWTTDIHETRIFWRKSLNVGSLAPGARYEVRDSHKADVIERGRVKFIFRIKSGK